MFSRDLSIDLTLKLCTFKVDSHCNLLHLYVKQYCDLKWVVLLCSLLHLIASPDSVCHWPRNVKLWLVDVMTLSDTFRNVTINSTVQIWTRFKRLFTDLIASIACSYVVHSRSCKRLKFIKNTREQVIEHEINFHLSVVTLCWSIFPRVKWLYSGVFAFRPKLSLSLSVLAVWSTKWLPHIADKDLYLKNW